jgi:hypothetical protein
MPLKRVTPSFTVEYRQAKRPNTGDAKPGWARAKPGPAGRDEKANRIAMSAFKTVAAHPPSDVISPSIVPGRILPSLIETAPVTEQADAGGTQSRSHESVSKAAGAMQVPGDVTVARHFGEHAYPAEDLEPCPPSAPLGHGASMEGAQCVCLRESGDHRPHHGRHLHAAIGLRLFAFDDQEIASQMETEIESLLSPRRYHRAYISAFV